MHIYIDESGVFKAAQNPDSWCVVAALMVPETDVEALRGVLSRLKTAVGIPHTNELKLGGIDEEDYFRFLSAIAELGCTVYCVATDMSLVDEAQIVDQRDDQARRVIAHIEKMKHEDGREAYRQLSRDLCALSPQLYMQFVCQVYLVHEVVSRGILYHVQRTPGCLHQFRWRADRKNTTKSLFEIAFELASPTLLQEISRKDPSIACSDFDYSAMSDFIYGDDAPTHLKDTYGINVDARGRLNIGKLFREDLAFPDSKSEEGLQAVDLIVSGMRRLLRGDFTQPATAARLLGALLVENVRGQYPLKLVSFARGQRVSVRIGETIMALTATARPMLVPRVRTRDSGQ